ncbi:galactokinase [Corynebacterium diphtheriae]|nr:galactokinase [Corynebacterium diphtheriae]
MFKRQHTDADVLEHPVSASAPATWSLIGEHTDHAGGVVLISVAQLRTHVEATTRADDIVSVDYYSADPEMPVQQSAISLSDVFEWQNSLSGDHEPLESPGDPSPALTVAVLIYYMVHRQLLSRDTHGFNVTVTSTIPEDAGLGDQEALIMAAALAFAHDYEDVHTAPIKAKFADVCFQASQAATGRPHVRARFDSALRGLASDLNIVDYSDGSVTHFPHPLNTQSDYAAFVVIPPVGAEQTAEVERRQAFITSAEKAFGTDSLRVLPDARERVIEWLQAVHEVCGTDDVPTITEAASWLEFMENETQAAINAAQAIKSRRHAACFDIVSESQRNLESLYTITTTDAMLSQLCLSRGAVSARSTEAGICCAIAAIVPLHHAQNFAADLRADGLNVIELQSGHGADIDGEKI